MDKNELAILVAVLLAIAIIEHIWGFKL